MIYLFLFYLALTIAIEGAIIAVLFRRLDYIYYSTLGNLLTNPLLNLMLLILVRIWGSGHYLAALIVLETAAFLAEAYVLKLLCRFSLGQALFVSGLVNLSSYVLGYAVQRWV